MARKNRKDIKKRRKNFLPTLLVIIALWAGLLFEIFFVDPNSSAAIPLFFLLIFFAQFFTLSTILLNTRRGFVLSFAFLIFAILRYFGVGNFLNLLLLIGVVITIEIYFAKN